MAGERDCSDVQNMTLPQSPTVQATVRILKTQQNKLTSSSNLFPVKCPIQVFSKLILLSIKILLRDYKGESHNHHLETLARS